jgi:hypothetical protein
MESLEQYLASEYPQDAQDVEEIETLLAQALRVYISRFDDKLAWRYVARANPADVEPQEALSQSTTAMVLGALLRYIGRYSPARKTQFGEASRAHTFPIEIKAAISTEIGQRIDVATDRLYEALKQTNREHLEKQGLKEQEQPGLRTKSSTFGQNDVFTLTWLAEAARANWSGSQLDAWTGIREFVAAEAKRILEESKNLTIPGALFKGGAGEPTSHAFPALRLVQTLRGLNVETHALPELFQFFQNLLHEQLSFSSIPDSRFDPAEMMFCLEGMLLCQSNVVDRTLFERAFTVLEAAQSQNAYWRPVKPYMSTNKGLVLFPVSIEVANCLLRCCQIFDKEKLHDTFGSRAIKLLRRYLQWLKARAVRFTDVKEPGGDDLVGWHSEHVNDPQVIHLWETSQVMEFLMSYRNALHHHIARTTLVRSRFSVKNLVTAEWANLEAQFEPVRNLGAHLRVYGDIGKKVVGPHIDGGAANYSILLYGPPGTGKTTVAESIAKALGRRLITITVSDFLAEGGVQVEARAKSIFDVLMAQTDAVVLFDEIDHFLLDRDSAHYRQQETVFQFMTPGMLTKLNDLRRSKRTLFLIATNYEDRIDPAIKRAGRIDLKYIVLPPDAAARMDILKGLLPKAFSTHIRALSKNLGKDDYSELANASALLGFKDMEAFVNTFEPENNDKVQVADLVRELTRRDRTISLEAYADRLTAKGVEPMSKMMRGQLSEFLYLVALHCESTELTSDSPNYVAIRRVASVINEDQLTQLAPLLDGGGIDKLKKTISFAKK